MALPKYADRRNVSGRKPPPKITYDTAALSREIVRNRSRDWLKKVWEAAHKPPAPAGVYSSTKPTYPRGKKEQDVQRFMRRVEAIPEKIAEAGEWLKEQNKPTVAPGYGLDYRRPGPGVIVGYNPYGLGTSIRASSPNRVQAMVMPERDKFRSGWPMQNPWSWPPPPEAAPPYKFYQGEWNRMNNLMERGPIRNPVEVRRQDWLKKNIVRPRPGGGPYDNPRVWQEEQRLEQMRRWWEWQTRQYLVGLGQDQEPSPEGDLGYGGYGGGYGYPAYGGGGGGYSGGHSVQPRANQPRGQQTYSPGQDWLYQLISWTI